MKFPWVLVFDLGISNFKIVAHNFAEFPGVKNLVFSRISKGNVTNLKFPEGDFQKIIPTQTPPPTDHLTPPTGLEFFWNSSPITDRWVSSKKSNYFNGNYRAIGTTQKKFQAGGEGWGPEISWGVYWKVVLRKFQRLIKKRIGITRGGC